MTRVDGSDLVNLLNHINFLEGTIFARFQHPRRQESLSFQAFPLPTTDETIVCRWVPPGIPSDLAPQLRLEDLLISDGATYVTVGAELVAIDSQTVTFRVPAEAWERTSRRVARQEAQGVSVRLLQNGLVFYGRLVEFQAFSFRVDVPVTAEADLGLVNAAVPVYVILEKGGRTLFSGECLVQRSLPGPVRYSLVLAPTFSNLRRHAATDFRTLRHVLVPAPEFTVVHPLTDKKLSLPLVDLSGMGFAVEEFFASARLFPGLLLESMELRIGHHFVLKCSGQVLYRNVLQKDVVRYGICFLDMALADQARLAALLHQTMNANLKACSPLDLDDLWRFFFDTGFFYPSKYAGIERSREEFKRVFEKLYLQAPSISRHFVYQDKGIIFAHLSMVRAFPQAWMIHHHAATKKGHLLAGVAVLDQITHYLNEFYRHRTTHLRYVMCYFREENRFPNRVFGGTARDVDEPKGISLDKFAYLDLPPAGSEEQVFQLLPATREDLGDLRSFYERVSGGLLLDALNLTENPQPEEELNREYALLGFHRDHLVFSLKQRNVLKAVVSLNVSEAGINLSNLTNCLQVLVLDREDLEPSVLWAALAHLTSHFGKEDLPLLLYPTDWLHRHSVVYEKEYTLWVMCVTHKDGYVRSLRSKFRGHYANR